MGKTKTRLLWPDVAKGIGIIAIILGYMGINDINRVVFLFHVPLFFVVSGYFFKPQVPFRQLLKNKSQTLLLPYIYTCIAICVLSVIRAVWQRQDAAATLKSWILASLYGAGSNWESPFYIKQIGAIWFLLALFYGFLLCWWCMQKPTSRVFILIALVFICLLISQYVWLPTSILAGPIAAMYILIGYTAKSTACFSEKGYSVVAMAACVVVLILDAWKFNGLWLVSNYFGNGILDLACTICGVYLVIHISRIISEKLKLLAWVLKFYGKNSLFIMCIHLIELNVFPWEKVYESASRFGITWVATLALVIMMKLVYVTVGTIIKELCLKVIKEKRE